MSKVSTLCGKRFKFACLLIISSVALFNFMAPVFCETVDNEESSKKAFQRYLACIETNQNRLEQASTMKGAEVDQILQRDNLFTDYPFQSSKKWRAMRGPTLEVVDSYASTKYKGGEVYLARAWHHTIGITTRSEAAITCLNDYNDAVGDIRYVTAFLNGKNAPLSSPDERESFVDARPFFGFQVCQNNHFYIPNTAFLNAALDEVSKRLTTKYKAPIAVRYYETESVDNSTLHLLEKFSTHLLWPRAKFGYYFHHDTFFHTVFSFLPVWIYEEMASYVAFILRVRKLSLLPENKEKIAKSYAATGGKTTENINEIFDHLLGKVARNLDQATANITDAVYSYFDHQDIKTLGTKTLQELTVFYSYRKYLSNNQEEKRISDGAKFMIAERLPTGMKKRGKFAEILISLAKENGIEPPPRTRLLSISKNKKYEKLGLEILKRRNDILNAAHSF